VLSLSLQASGLCVAGTHGKTTTSTMTAHLFHQSHIECTAFLGGISKNYHQSATLSEKPLYRHRSRRVRPLFPLAVPLYVCHHCHSRLAMSAGYTQTFAGMSDRSQYLRAFLYFESVVDSLRKALIPSSKQTSSTALSIGCPLICLSSLPQTDWCRNSWRCLRGKRYILCAIGGIGGRSW